VVWITELLLLLLLLFTAIELSLGGSSPYNSTDKTNKNKYMYKRNNTKTQYKQNTVNITETPTHYKTNEESYTKLC
jgi:hypothetical protein